MKKREEGFIQTRGGKVWYETVGDRKGTPILVVHGGPGFPHDSLAPLEDLANERKVIFYDQLGCGNSQKINDKSFWTLEYFVEELQTVIKSLNLNTYHILGQSWGAALAAAHATTKPKGLKSLILANPYISTPRWEDDADRLISKFPKTLRKALKNPDSKNYGEASRKFYFKHLYMMKNLPVQSLKASFKMNTKIYNHMWGPEEFRVTGTLKKLDLSEKLKKIEVPTLFICGRYDEATPESAMYFQSLIKGSELKVFEKSAHMPHWTERKAYIQTIKAFLK